MAHHIRTRSLADLVCLLHPLKGLEFFGLLVVVELQAGIAAALEPLGSDGIASADFLLQLLVGSADLVNGMVGCEAVLLEPLVDVLLLFLKLANVFDGALQNGTLVLIAVWYEAGDLVDSLVDSLTSASLN